MSKYYYEILKPSSDAITFSRIPQPIKLNNRLNVTAETTFELLNYQDSVTVEFFFSAPALRPGGFGFAPPGDSIPRIVSFFIS